VVTPPPAPAASARKLAEVGLLWLAALGISALLRWAGVHWSERLPIEPLVVAALVLLPPLLLALVLLARWPAVPEAGPVGGPEGGEGGESCDCAKEQG
jgi:hypothetical protein